MRTRDTGFTLVEVLVASVILAAALLGLASLFAAGVKQNAVAKEETVMAALAQDKLESLKKLDRGALDNLAPTAGCQKPCAGTCASGTNGACYDSTCGDDPANWYTSDDLSSLVRAFAKFEDPIPDPNPNDEIHENLYVRFWEVKKVVMPAPVGCVFKFRVIVGSRNGLLASKSSTGGGLWAAAKWQEVVGIDPAYPTNKRRVELATYKGR